MQLIVTFVILNVINVIIQTAKSIITNKGTRTQAAIANAIAYGLYTVVVIYMIADINIWIKVGVVATANLVGVFIVKTIEEKRRKEKLWKIECTVPTKNANKVSEELKGVPQSSVNVARDYTILNFYCATQSESKVVKSIVNKYGVKYFVSESKSL